MGKLEKKLVAFGLAGALAFGNGCAGKPNQEITPKEQYGLNKADAAYTADEKSWQDAAITIQIADAGITILGVMLNDYNESGREGNPLLGRDDKRLGMAKTAYLGLSSLTWKYFPQWRKGISQATMITGLAPLVFNVAQFLLYPFRK